MFKRLYILLLSLGFLGVAACSKNQEPQSVDMDALLAQASAIPVNIGLQQAPSVPPSAPLPTPREEAISATTASGAVLVRESGTMLGEAWKTPEGLIWGSPARLADGTEQFPQDGSLLGAKAYCNAHDARLPTSQEYELLRTHLGFGTQEGYSPQILPELEHKFWTATAVTCPSLNGAETTNASCSHYFDGATGELGISQDQDSLHIRCVSGGGAGSR